MPTENVTEKKEDVFTKNTNLSKNNAIIFLLCFFSIFNVFFSECTFNVTQDDIFLSFFAFLIPPKAQLFLIKGLEVRQKIYDKVTVYFLSLPVIKFCVKLFHKFLFSFRIISCISFDFINKIVPTNYLMYTIAIVLSKYGLANYLFIFLSMFFYLEFLTMPMLRFYKKYPAYLNELYANSKRNMWSKASKIVQEVANNPYAQSAAVGVAGMLVWKTMDVYDSGVQKEIANADREAENNRHAEEMATRRYELDESRKAREDEMTMRERELHESIRAREDENNRHAAEMAMRERELQQEKK